MFFRNHTVEDVLDALTRCDRLETSADVIAATAQRFSRAMFRSSLLGVLEEARGASVPHPPKVA